MATKKKTKKKSKKKTKKKVSATRKATRKTASRKAAPRHTDDPSLEKVREILFASERRSADERLTALEERVEAGLAAIQEDARQRIGTLGEHVREEVKILKAKLRELSKRVTALSNGTDEDFARVRRAMAKLGADSRGLLDAQAEELRSEIDTKTGRTDLAGLLGAVAAKLNGKGRA